MFSQILNFTSTLLSHHAFFKRFWEMIYFFKPYFNLLAVSIYEQEGFFFP